MRATGGAASYAITTQSMIIEMDDAVHLLEPNRAQLALLTSKISKKSVSNPKFEWSTDEHTPTLDAVDMSGGTWSTATDITVDNGGYFGTNSLVQVQRTGEVIHITAVSGDVITCIDAGRGWGDSTAAALLDNDSLTILGGIAAEGATSEISRTTKKEFAYNNTEIKRSPFEFTNTELATDLYGEADLAYQARKKAAEHSVEIENALLFGSRGSTATVGAITRSTGGINEFISSNDSDFGGIFNMVTFFNFCEDVFRYGSEKKLMLAARSVVTNISLEAIKYLEMVPKDDTFGIDIVRLLTPHGTLMVTKHNLLEGSIHGKMCFVLDMDNLGYRFLKGRDTKLKTNIQANDKDARKDEYITEFGLFRVHENTHGKITNAA
jgi:hypothetical protein